MNILPWKRKEERSPLSLQKEMNRLFDGFIRGFDLDFPLGGRGFSPALDVHETDEAVVVKAEIPGVAVKDLKISLTGDVLSLGGEKSDEREEKGETFHRVERSFGSFQRSVHLPAYIDAGSVTAEARDGVVTITIGKKAEVKPKKIDITVK